MLKQKFPSHFFGLAKQGVSLILALALLAMALPAPALAADPTSTPVNTTASSTAVCASYHIVKAGETFKGIAKEYGLTVSQLAAANDIKKPYEIDKGDKLCIPTTTTGVKSTKFKMDVTIQNHVLNVSVTGLPKNHTYVLKVREIRAGKAWTKLLSTSSTKDGALAVHSKLSDKLAQAQNLQVCLKDMGTDEVICRTVVNR